VTQYGTVNLNEFEILVKKKKINKKMTDEAKYDKNT
jgi:hypothetical protein